MKTEKPTIEVVQLGSSHPMQFEVAVSTGGTTTEHIVTLSAWPCDCLPEGEHDPADVIEAAFRFLLDREPKEAILRSFDLTVIARYFPEFEQELPGYLARLTDPAAGARP